MICGPTASGKSKLANELAKQFNGEVVSADSMQIYEGLVIGTAAVTQEEAGGIEQHMVGFLSPNKTFSVAEYVKLAQQCIDSILQKGKVPIVCGGTGLYLSALQQGTIFTEEKPSAELRKELQRQWDELGAQAMLDKLKQVDAEYAKVLPIADEKRILRALEQWELTGKTRKQRDDDSKGEPKYNFYCICLTYSERETLYNKINMRVDKMVEDGLLQEAKWVFENQHEFKTAAQSIGYKEYFPYFEEEKNIDFCTEVLKQATRRYAKRQITWFRAMPDIHWVLVDDFETAQINVKKQVAEFL